MLARAMEMKEDALEQGSGSGLLGSHQDEAQGSSCSAHACCHNLSSQNSVSSVPSAKAFEHPLKMLQKSHSWPLETMHCEEDDACGRADETVVVSI